MCDACIESSGYRRCERCGTRDKNGKYTVDGWVCDDCLEDYGGCDRCGQLVCLEDLYYISGDTYYCGVCREEVAEDVAEVLHEHWAKLPVVFHNTDGSIGERSGALYYGLELEMECGSSGVVFDTARAIMQEDESDYYLESDGSLNDGIEVVCHARTFESWQEYIDVFDRVVLQKAQNNKCTAHDAKTCGIHIHTTLACWEEAQLMRLFGLLYNPAYYQAWLKISQRHKDRLDRWASLDMNDVGKVKTWRSAADKAKKKLCEKRSPFKDRYSALNITEETVEFRLFNSNLRKERVMKNIECVYSLYEYTKSALRVSWKGFMQWVKRHQNTVPFFYAFLAEISLIETSEGGVNVCIGNCA